MVAGYILLAGPVELVCKVVVADHQVETVDGGGSLNHM